MRSLPLSKRPIEKKILVLFALIPVMRVVAQPDTLAAQADTLTAQVIQWNKMPVTPTNTGENRVVLTGSTHDLVLLDIRGVTIKPGQSSPQPLVANHSDQLLIVKEGRLKVTAGSTAKLLGPGGVALFAVGDRAAVRNPGSAPVTYYLFCLQSRSPIHPDRAHLTGGPILTDWPEMEMKQTAKGESRQIFDRPVAWLGKIDMHATTLNPGEVSHLPHSHRAEEIILMRSGHVKEYIDGRFYPAAAGDVIFLPSGSLHAVENKSNERCEYFALQWLQ